MWLIQEGAHSASCEVPSSSLHLGTSSELHIFVELVLSSSRFPATLIGSNPSPNAANQVHALVAWILKHILELLVHHLHSLVLQCLMPSAMSFH